MKKVLIMQNIILFFMILLLFSPLYAQTYYFDFAVGYDGWTGNFADYPVVEDSLYELEFVHTSLPSNIDSTQRSLKISGNNHSDDLFMYIYKQITGLQPNTSYDLTFNIEFASNAATNRVGVGGAPGEGVVMKVGAVPFEPQRVINYEQGHPEGYYLINLDKGGLVSPGKDMVIVGHVGVSDTTTVFTLKTNTNDSFPFRFKTNSSGSAWIVIGTDSGFEGITTLFYNRITASFAVITTIWDSNKQNENLPNTPRLYQNYPNPFNPSTTIEFDLPKSSDVTLKIFNILGEEVATLVSDRLTAGSYFYEWDASNLASGVYLYRLETGEFQDVEKMVLIK